MLRTHPVFKKWSSKVSMVTLHAAESQTHVHTPIVVCSSNALPKMCSSLKDAADLDGLIAQQYSYAATEGNHI